MLSASSPRRFASLYLLLFLVFVTAVAPYRAFAHAVLVDSSPRPNAVLDGTSIEVILRYNSRIDAARCSLTLITPDGHQQSLPPDTHVAPNILQTRLQHLGRGSYTLRWQALATDGHITRGTLPFAVR